LSKKSKLFFLFYYLTSRYLSFILSIGFSSIILDENDLASIQVCFRLFFSEMDGLHSPPNLIIFIRHIYPLASLAVLHFFLIFFFTFLISSLKVLRHPKLVEFSNQDISGPYMLASAILEN
jgi:hypothetical protein